MSSYFDKAAVMFTGAMKNSTERDAEKIVETVVQTYGTYLTYISCHMSRAMTQQHCFGNLKLQWLKLIARPLVDDMDRDTFASFFIESIHDFAHTVGRSGLKRRDGRPFLDNPYPAVKTDLIIEAMR